MKKLSSIKHGQAVLLFLSGIEILIVAFYYFAHRSDVDRAFLWGYSVSKLLLILILTLISFGLLGSSIQLIINKPFKINFQTYFQRLVSLPLLKYFFLFMGMAGWVVSITPLDRFDVLKNYVEISKPLLVLIIVVSFQCLGYLLFLRKNENDFLKGFWKENKYRLWASGVLFIVLVGGWCYLTISRLGFAANGEDWNETGVPVLGWQVLVAIVCGLIFVRVEHLWNKKRLSSLKLDIFMFMFIWIVGGGLWAGTPVPNGYLNPGPYPPTYETYPFADAARFDLMSQYALIGQGLNNGKAYNRPLYPAFLVYLHVFSGQSYEQNMQLQAFLYGIFPALAYLFAKLLSNRGAGISAAVVIILRGVNGIAATNMINLANQKQMLTGFPTAVAVGLILLGAFLWAGDARKIHKLMILGGAFGFAMYLRQTVMGILPLILLLPFLVKDLTKKVKIIALGVFLLGILVAVSPHEVYSLWNNRNYSYPLTIRKIITVANSRYPVSGKDKNNNTDTSETQSDEQETSNEFANATITTVMNHFSRNVITSILVLPSSFLFKDLQNTIKEENSFWHSSWNGYLNFEQKFFLGLNLLLISLGIVYSNKYSIVGLLPLGSFIGYNLANALARSSGGRYIVPVDWILVLYFVVGLFTLCAWGISTIQRRMFLFQENRDNQNFVNISNSSYSTSRDFLSGIFILGMMGSLLVIPNFIFGKQIIKNEDQIQLEQIILKSDLQVEWPRLEEFLDNRKMVVSYGQVMYPRYYQAGEGEYSFYFPYKILDYPRTAFHLIGPNGTREILLRGTLPKELINLNKVIILGCKEKGFIDTVAIISTEPGKQIYLRDPFPDEPNCPLPVP